MTQGTTTTTTDEPVCLVCGKPAPNGIQIGKRYVLCKSCFMRHSRLDDVKCPVCGESWLIVDRMVSPYFADEAVGIRWCPPCKEFRVWFFPLIELRCDVCGYLNLLPNGGCCKNCGTELWEDENGELIIEGESNEYDDDGEKTGEDLDDYPFGAYSLARACNPRGERRMSYSDQEEYEPPVKRTFKKIVNGVVVSERVIGGKAGGGTQRVGPADAPGSH